MTYEQIEAEKLLNKAIDSFPMFEKITISVLEEKGIRELISYNKTEKESK